MKLIQIVFEKATAAIAAVIVFFAPVAPEPAAPAKPPVKEILDGASTDAPMETEAASAEVKETLDAPIYVELLPEPVTIDSGDDTVTVTSVRVYEPEESEPEERDEAREKRAANPLREQENNVATKTKLYTITPQEGSPLKPRSEITADELREYVLRTNYDVIAFRKAMEEATVDELVKYLEQNGFEVEVTEARE